VSGSETALFTDHDFHWFPLSNPGIISIPAGFFFGWLGTVTTKDHTSEVRFIELEVRALTGAGSEK
jgi:cation/acetate symporter